MKPQAFCGMMDTEAFRDDGAAGEHMVVPEMVVPETPVRIRHAA